MNDVNATDPPPGFRISERSSNLLDLLGPLYESHAEPGYRIGLRVDQRHCNAKGFCHGAVLAMLADIELGRICALSREPRLGLVTVGLTLSYLAAARTGQWLEASGQIDRIGQSLAFSTGLVTADGRPCLRAAGTFQVLA